MTRTKIREHIFCILFRIDLYSKEEMREQCAMYIDGLDSIANGEREYIVNKVSDLVSKVDEIDSLIDRTSVGWKVSRMAKTDLTALRLACYEILFEDIIPDKVAINEAVNLVKKYGTDSSQAFVNGVLAKVVNGE